MGFIVGIDEVGRGSWAGPMLVVAAKPISDMPQGVTDSKLLAKKRRKDLYELIRESFQFGEGWVQSEEIDEYGLAQAMRIGVSRALIALGSSIDDEIILDGNVNYCPTEFSNTKCVIDADVLYPIVSAASIYAKVKRDEYMQRIAKFYPAYGFEKHVGYGTRFHREMLQKHGPCQLHRRSYKPIAELLGAKA